MMVNRTKTNLLIISHLHDACSQQVQKLIQIADAAAELRQPDLLLEASSTLYKLGQDEASHFYLALANRRRTGQETPSRAILSDLAERAGKLWRAKALTTLGTLDFHKGNHREATDYYAQARRLSPDSLTYLHAQEMTAQIASLEGDHKTAVRILSQTLPLASSKGIHGLNHRNSLAVELNHLGRVDEARYYLQPCLSSPYRIYYPEWSETAKEVYSPSRSLISIPSVKISARVTATHPRALMDDFTRFKQRKQTASPRSPSEPQFLVGHTAYSLNLSNDACQVLIRLAEILHTRLDFEAAQRIEKGAEQVKTKDEAKLLETMLITIVETDKSNWPRILEAIEKAVETE